MAEASPVHVSRRETRNKGTFVLVHPAWFGGWCWKKVTPLLRARGCDVHTPTLTGLGERAHLAAGTLRPIGHFARMRDVRQVGGRELAGAPSRRLSRGFGMAVVHGILNVEADVGTTYRLLKMPERCRQ